MSDSNEKQYVHKTILDKLSQTIVSNLKFFILGTLIASIIIILYFVKLLQTNLIEASAIAKAETLANTIINVRSIYTQTVVNRVDKTKTIVSHDFDEKAGAIPLPATLTIKLGDKIAKNYQSLNIKLYSPFPFPWRTKKGGLKDSFSQRAWEELNTLPDKPYYSFGYINDEFVLRYAKADILLSECVSCHNSHKDTPKNDWQAGEVRGILEVMIPMNNVIALTKDNVNNLVILFIILGLTSALLISIALRESSRQSTSLKKISNNLELQNATLELQKVQLLKKQDEFEKEKQRANTNEKSALKKTIELEKSRKATLNILQDISIAKDEAQSASKAKSEFIASMSHELRTPMNGVLGMAQLLLDTELTTEQKKHIQTIYQSGNSLLEIINDILDFSKAEAGHMQLDPKPFNLQQTLEQIQAVIKPRADEKGIKLKFNTDKTIPEMLVGDDIRLRQILINLAGNAIKFTKQGSVTVETKLIKSKKHQATLKFSVIDTGIGIASQKLNSLFNAFEQADSSTTREFGGTGLGLTISLYFANLMDSKINVESELSKGSNFYFEVSLPISDEQISTTDKKSTIEDLNLNVLLTEDNHVNQLVAKAMLENMGCKVTIANTGIEALQNLEKNTYDLVLMDCHMPEMDGYEATTAIRSNPKTQNTIIIALTANAMEEDREKCINVGMNDFLSKPLDKDTLYQCLRSWKEQIAKSKTA